ncbi:Cysteine desulfurase [Candidatus Magnetomoraceae bacterium gMMP-13]
MNIIYFDNNATTQVAPEVVEEMLPYFSELYGNPSSSYGFASQAAQKINEARSKTALLIGAEPEEIIFTSCGTESDNTAIIAAIMSNPDKKHIITTSVEHPAVKSLCEFFSEKGYKITFVPVDTKGRLDLDYLYDHLDDNTAIVSIMLANNETGVIFPIEEISSVLKERGIIFHTDAVQGIGKIPIDVNKIGVDMLSISGHKFHAPKGIGALYVRKGTKFSPFLIGGGQESGRRGGTENTASIVGLGKASELAKSNLDNVNSRVRYLRDKLESKILKCVPDAAINGDTENRLPNTSSISFEKLEAKAILSKMDEFNICASAGSACSSGSIKPSNVLHAMGLPLMAAHGTIRFSLGIYNTEQEIDFIIEKLTTIIEQLKES